MLMNNAAKGLRRGIGNIDSGVIGPTIYDTFINEMMYNPDESIKGDCIVVPRGASAILIKESAQQRRMQFIGMTGNPVDMQIIGLEGRASLLRETAAAMELPVDDIVPSDDMIKQKQAQEAQAQQAQLEAQQKMLENQQATQAQLEQQKAQAQSDREAQKMQMSMIGDIVKQAVAHAMSTKKPSSIKYQHDEKGNLVGATAE
jgi:hypothetical protein